ncbi:proteasome assembly chaperone 4-like [Uloborus diversus]|uniref:proteasome assembly chaperone 4-like n=1 Tax=Uloborus diversus TaxID=327109 RepID=UPI00240A65FD|nr:proteasome assembly chaperone 4-like [Uloborus diversus]
MSSSKDSDIISTHLFQDVLLDVPVTFYVIRMKDCLFLWIGDQGKFESLAVAIKTPYNSSPLCTSIMGYSADDHSSALAAKLSTRIGKQVFASYNLSNSSGSLVILVCERIFREYLGHPEHF